MNTAEMKRHLESQGCKFRRRGPVWACYLGKDQVARWAYLGELVWKAAKALGED